MKYIFEIIYEGMTRLLNNYFSKIHDFVCAKIINSEFSFKNFTIIHKNIHTNLKYKYFICNLQCFSYCVFLSSVKKGFNEDNVLHLGHLF